MVTYLKKSQKATKKLLVNNSSNQIQYRYIKAHLHQASGIGELFP